jgi:hypothetical protein
MTDVYPTTALLRSRREQPPPVTTYGGPVEVTTFTTTSVIALPQPVNLSLYAGDDFYLDLVLTSAVDASALDLSGCSCQAQIRATAADSTVLAAFVTSILGNVVTLHLSHTVSATLVPGVWDAQLIAANGDIVTLVAGSVTVAPEVTRP